MSVRNENFSKMNIISNDQIPWIVIIKWTDFAHTIACPHCHLEAHPKPQTETKANICAKIEQADALTHSPGHKER